MGTASSGASRDTFPSAADVPAVLARAVALLEESMGSRVIPGAGAVTGRPKPTARTRRRSAAAAPDVAAPAPDAKAPAWQRRLLADARRDALAQADALDAALAAAGERRPAGALPAAGRALLVETLTGRDFARRAAEARLEGALVHLDHVPGALDRGRGLRPHRARLGLRDDDRVGRLSRLPASSA